MGLSFFAYHVILSSLGNPNYTPLTNNLFAADLSALVVDNKSTENVVYSPLSVHISLALLLMGAADHTENELKNALRLGKEPKENLAIKYGFFLNETLKTRPNGPRLLLANHLFVNYKVNIIKKIRDIASYYFKSQMENIDFSNPLWVSERINDWIKQQTNNDTKDLSRSQTMITAIDDILVNTVSFSPVWEQMFNPLNTKKRDFHVSASKKVSVDTMFLQSHFRYAELYTLNAKALELPYLYRNISMLIILPNEIDGLEKLEKDLKGMDLNEIVAQMKNQSVDLYLPKFRMESEIDLKEPLKKMGCSSMFEKANFSNMFHTVYGEKIFDVKQKTIMDCNEKGALNVVGHPNTTTEEQFRADHPFVFIIRTKTMVLFHGHLAKF